MRGKWPLAGGLVVLLAIAAGVATGVRSGAFKRKPPPPPPAAQPAPVSELSLMGTVQAKTVVNIPAPTEGVIQRFMADVGEDVFEGELLAQIRNGKLQGAEQTAESDATRAQARVSEFDSALIAARLEASRARSDASNTRSEVERAEKAYERQKLLVQEGATPRLVYEKAEADYKKLKADSESLDQLAVAAEEHVDSLSRELENARKVAGAKAEELDEAKADLGAGEVHSSVNGIVVGRQGQVGEPVNRAMPDLFQIGVDLSSLQLVVTPDSKFLPRIKPGQPVMIQIAEAPGGLPGTVREIKAGQVFIDFTSPSQAIRPGLTAQVRMKLDGG